MIIVKLDWNTLRNLRAYQNHGNKMASRLLKSDPTKDQRYGNRTISGKHQLHYRKLLIEPVNLFHFNF